MITRVQVKNFRNLANVDVSLGPLTVLVGRNGTGKSTFLDALRFVRDALRLGLDTAISQRGGIEAIKHWSPSAEASDIEISVELTQLHGSAYYSFSIGTGQKEERRIKHESLELYRGSDRSLNCFETKNGEWIETPTHFPMKVDNLAASPISPNNLMLPSLSFLLGEMRTVCDQITETDFYTISPNTLRLPQRQTSEATLREGGENLGTILRQMMEHGLFSADLAAALGQVVENVCDIRIKEVGGYLVTELGHEAPNGQTAWFPLAQESDGTLRVLGLLAALYQNAPHSLIAIEEPELSIHPGALAVLSEVIQEAATRSQVIITTQSPDLISRFRADQLRVVERVGTQTRIGPIDDGQREAINSQLFSAGDLLRIEGLHVSAQEEIVPSYA